MALYTNMTAWYTTSQKVDWWFESGAPATLRKTVTMQGARTPVEKMDLGQPEIEYCSTTYDFRKGQWSTSTDQPPQSLTIDDSDSDDGGNGAGQNGQYQNGYAIRSKGASRGGN